MNQAIRRDKPTFRERLRRGLLLFAGLYFLICAGCATFQRRLIYYPSVLTPEQVGQMAQAAGLERWTNAAGQFIGLKRRSPKQPAEGSVMVIYGNGSTAVGSGHYADEIQTVAAFDVFILEYPGYEDRPGSPSQKSLFHAADEAFRRLPANQPIYLLGESLGTGVASYLAGTYPDRIAGVVLISPFSSLTDVAQSHFPVLPVRWFLVDRFPSEKYLRSYHDKLGVTVGGKDTVVPKKFGLRLYQGYGGPKKLWEFPDGGHCQIMEPPSQFWKEVVDFWRSGFSR
ncbi:MAG TPA: alpha/beta fold hydrolase [Verrucomicrobiae bacterium]|nr:alpha/beta fold hydrolase [Verrucomicrobiae bacterium]